MGREGQNSILSAHPKQVENVLTCDIGSKLVVLFTPVDIGIHGSPVGLIEVVILTRIRHFYFSSTAFIRLHGEVLDYPVDGESNSQSIWVGDKILESPGVGQNWVEQNLGIFQKF